MTAAILSVPLCSLLLWSSAEKLRNPRPLVITMNRLGLPMSRPVAHLISVAEAAVGFTAILWRGTIGASVAVASIGLVFAAAGALAIARRTNIRCSCFGAAYSSRLGARQLAALPIWLGSAYALRRAARVSILAGLRTILAMLVALAMLKIATIAVGYRRASKDRQIARQTARMLSERIRERRIGAVS